MTKRTVTAKRTSAPGVPAPTKDKAAGCDGEGSRKVYGYTGWRHDCPPARNGSRQTREIVAARSAAEAARLFGISPWRLRSYGCETGNADEIRVAMSKPGAVFWRPLNERTEFDGWAEA